KKGMANMAEENVQEDYNSTLDQPSLDPTPESEASSSSAGPNDIITNGSSITETEVEELISQFATTSTRFEVTNASDADFNYNLGNAILAIDAEIYPQLICEGSSGSYYVFDQKGQKLAVFKPKDEEPFAPGNPKWPKFFQRVLCICCFGRACLIPNIGYLAETAASIIDERLELHVVPKTRIVKLKSPTFNYRKWFYRFISPSYFKEGSYQLYVDGYRQAGEVLREWETNENALTEEERRVFIEKFQRMCVLDYVIRNTDRHDDNWLIRHVPGKDMKIAAIDNGLSFPFQHPECTSRFRTFPFAWASLNIANEPWDRELRQKLLKKLTQTCVDSLCREIRCLFRHHRSENSESMIRHNQPLLIRNQMRVLRGQIWNLREALENDETPAEMVRKTPILVSKRRNKKKSDDWKNAYKVKNAVLINRFCWCCCC
uniref:Phosphatidylinositol 4-kinase type 2 n=1 Tax=Acrobeloides nanus TaxID=290746 RepID=A0A914BW04_9BILA